MAEMGECERNIRDMPWMHIYAQPYWHQQARICGTRQALMNLRDAINQALNDGGKGGAKAIASDGEGYGVAVELVTMDALGSMRLPYTDDIAREAGAPS